jgi:L-histidine N-alpha-methyltransferase
VLPAAIFAEALNHSPDLSPLLLSVAAEARKGLTAAPKTLAPWLFYDDLGSSLFERIAALPEYYLTRTERSLFEIHADDIFAQIGQPVTIVELGAGTASKTGILLRAAAALQPNVLYQPIDVSAFALDEAQDALDGIPGIAVRPLVANYITDPIRIERPPHHRILALYIGSSIGNFAPEEAVSILRNLRSQMGSGDALLLGTDLAPSASKSVESLLAAYDDAEGVTAAFNRNILTRLNRDLGANFDRAAFHHLARWNAAESRIEMHLVSIRPQTVHLPASPAGPALDLHFDPGESIHTENSYKFTPATIAALLTQAGFAATRTFTDSRNLFAVTLATAI